MLRTFDLRLKPQAAQRSELERILADSVETYNAAWQERREAWKLCQKRITYYDQQAELTELRQEERSQRTVATLARLPALRTVVKPRP